MLISRQDRTPPVDLVISIGAVIADDATHQIIVATLLFYYNGKFLHK